jgi:hypothetical protein
MEFPFAATILGNWKRLASAFGGERRDGMSAIGFRGAGLERLIDRHTELCGLFDGKGPPVCRETPILITPNIGKATAECLADLVDQALEAYGGSGSAQDPRIFALKIALTDAIVEMA